MKTPPKPAPLLTKAQEHLVAKWMPLAHGIVAKQAVGDKADQLSYAMWALTKFARLYDPARGYSEQALATRAIKMAMIDCHRSAARHAGNVELKDHHLSDTESPLTEPPPKWTPPPEPDAGMERPLTKRQATVLGEWVRPAGMSPRSLRRRAKEQGWSRPRGRGRALDGQALLRILQADRHISTAALAQKIGLHRRTLSRGKNGQLLARCRELAKARIFDHAKASRSAADRAPTQGQDAGSAPAKVRG